MWTALAVTFAAAAITSVVLTPWIIRFARSRGVLDHPDVERRVHTRAVPRLGGIAVFGGMVCGLLAFALLGTQVMQGSAAYLEFSRAVVVGGGILFLAGVADDILGLRPLTKLLAQVLAAVALYALGFSIDSLGFGGGPGWELGMLSLPFTVFWVVAVTNAFNLIDGMDGLATGIALVALLTLLAIVLVLGRMDVAVVCAALVGALAAFLPFNSNPAKIFLGDCGSLFVGFMLAVLSVSGAAAGTATVLALVPLFVLALPLLDTGLAMLRRWLRGLPISSADKRHIHHRLLAMGLTTRRAALVLYAVTTAFAVIALLIALAPPRVISFITLAGGVLTLGLIVAATRCLDYHEFTAVQAAVAKGPIKLRKILRDRIHAQDLARVIAVATTLKEVNAVLHDGADLFHFGHVEVCRLRSQDSIGGAHARWNMSAWKIDYPVGPYDPETGDWYVLRIWCHMADGFRPYGAERVAGILGPVIESWLSEHPRVDLPVSPQTVRRSLEFA
jgi:UDP-GlcNAc:undecaprenyl-phosphate GlcNAc-1-phosphate transferase